MSEECKTARNAVLIPLAILIGLLMFCSSCSSLQFGDYNRWQEVNRGKINCNK